MAFAVVRTSPGEFLLRFLGCPWASRRPAGLDPTNKKEPAMADNSWALGGPAGIAQALRNRQALLPSKTDNGLTAPVPKSHRDEQNLASRCGDRAFKRAMLKAIRCGAERVSPGVVKCTTTRYIRRILAPTDSGYRSSAGYTADMGGTYSRSP